MIKMAFHLFTCWLRKKASTPAKKTHAVENLAKN